MVCIHIITCQYLEVFCVLQLWFFLSNFFIFFNLCIKFQEKLIEYSIFIFLKVQYSPIPIEGKFNERFCD